MNRSLIATACLFTTLVAAAVGLGAPAHAASAQTASPVDVVKSFLDAGNSHDETRLRQLMAPSFKDLEDPGFPDADVVSPNEFIQQVIGGGILVTVQRMEQTGPQTVVIDDMLTFTGTGPEALHLPHPFTETTTVTVVNGQITLLSEVLSAQTRQDLAALAPTTTPGMPTTGGPDAFIAPVLVLLALGLMTLVSGLWLRRTAQTTR
jgi:hypothetical protein